MRFKFATPIATLLVLLLDSKSISSVRVDNSATVMQCLTEANKFYSNGDLNEALKHYMKCLEEDPNQPDCLCNMGSVLLDGGKTDEAEFYYRRALHATGSEHAGALYNLALMLQDGRKEGDLLDAMRLYSKLIEIEPKNEEAWANLGAVFHQLGELQKSVRTYMKAIELYIASSTEDENYHILSTLHENVGRATLRLSERIVDNEESKKALEKKAVEFLQAAIASNPSNEVLLACTALIFTFIIISFFFSHCLRFCKSHPHHSLYYYTLITLCTVRSLVLCLPLIFASNHLSFFHLSFFALFATYSLHHTIHVSNFILFLFLFCSRFLKIHMHLLIL
jgi:tetratricopeptide (TPR) repeat protein